VLGLEQFGDGWPTGKSSRVRTSEDKVRRKDLCWSVRVVYVLDKLPDVSGPSLGEAGRYSLLHYICRSCAAKLKPSISRVYLVAICIFILIFFWSHPGTHWWMWEGVCIAWHHHIHAAAACIRAATLKFTTQLLHTVWYFFWSNSSIEINGWKSW